MPEPRFVDTEALKKGANATINFDGGSLTASRGVFLAMFEAENNYEACESTDVARKRVSHFRTEYIGAEVKSVAEANWTQKKFNSQTKSRAAGGEAIQIRINGEWWTARLSGSHEALMSFLCDNSGDLKDVISWRSERGTLYGPIGQLTPILEG